MSGAFSGSAVLPREVPKFGHATRLLICREIVLVPTHRRHEPAPLVLPFISTLSGVAPAGTGARAKPLGGT
jgi:hypothetical protein